MQLTGFDVTSFTRDDWQKRPRLLRGACQGWTNPLAPDELAGLACEEEIEARLVVQTQGRWMVEQGPFSKKRFSRLGSSPWTLLVNAVDQHVPEVQAMLEALRFVPNWRVD